MTESSFAENSLPETSIEQYLQNMPGGALVAENWQHGEPHLVIVEGIAPSSLLDLVILAIPEVQRIGAAVGVYMLPPRVAEVVRWECEHAHSTPFDQLWHFEDLGPIPQWGAAMPERAAALIASAYDLGDQDIVALVAEVATLHNADVLSVLQVVLDQYWQADDMLEFITAASKALAGQPLAAQPLRSTTSVPL